MKCTFCEREEKNTATELWATDDGQSVEVARSRDVSVEDPWNPDGKIICESCYQQGRVSRYNASDLLEIHTQFGLEYLHADQPEKAETAFREALQIKTTADGLANLACCLSKLDRNTEAKNLYLLALDMDKDHFIARNNLANIQRLHR
ncbi:MAG: hypothetical protein BGO12_16420 [Verrucomicrobia bacterium 61-8]|nr:hypothetical protein [Verrucomicrobiota bacterium]OJV16139.1 MAG: hypothetical protein BGO12_16420 [Verrucomicrobia bacterium 61-8]